MAKRLTLTERRLSFAFAEGTPRPEGQALRRPRGGPMEAALNFGPFVSRQKDKKTTDARHRSGRRRHDMPAGATLNNL